MDTPITETAILGLGVGSAAAGLRPIVELMFMDFMGVCMDEINNQAAKMRYMFGGKAKLPMVVRTTCGAGMSAAGQHSQSLEAWLAHIPGVKVVMPATPADAKGLMEGAVRDDNPVFFIEHKGLFGLSGEVPEGEYVVPPGKAAVLREGKDVSLIAWSAMVHRALAAADMLEKEGISPRWSICGASCRWTRKRFSTPSARRGGPSSSTRPAVPAASAARSQPSSPTRPSTASTRR